jgi:exonuclease III
MNSLRGDVKQQEIKNILNSRVFDLVFLNETKLDSSFPVKFFTCRSYNIIRRDRGGCSIGGGIMVFVKKLYSITMSTKSDTYEILSFSIKIYGKNHTFICAYRSPN